MFKYAFWFLLFFNGGFLTWGGNCPPCPPASYGHVDTHANKSYAPRPWSLPLKTFHRVTCTSGGRSVGLTARPYVFLVCSGFSDYIPLSPQDRAQFPHSSTASLPGNNSKWRSEEFLCRILFQGTGTGSLSPPGESRTSKFTIPVDSWSCYINSSDSLCWVGGLGRRRGMVGDPSPSLLPSPLTLSQSPSSPIPLT